jgi:C4-type Zn-finger protein
MHFDTTEMRLKGWVDCPNCGRGDKLATQFDLRVEIAGPLRLQSVFICQKCGRRDAALTLERTVVRTH